jgi:hypothetical protein
MRWAAARCGEFPVPWRACILPDICILMTEQMRACAGHCGGAAARASPYRGAAEQRRPGIAVIKTCTCMYMQMRTLFLFI